MYGSRMRPTLAHAFDLVLTPSAIYVSSSLVGFWSHPTSLSLTFAYNPYFTTRHPPYSLQFLCTIVYTKLSQTSAQIKMCYQVVERYSVCRCLYHKHAVDPCAVHGQRGHTVQEKTVLVGYACGMHSNHRPETTYNTGVLPDSGYGSGGYPQSSLR